MAAPGLPQRPGHDLHGLVLLLFVQAMTSTATTREVCTALLILLRHHRRPDCRWGRVDCGLRACDLWGSGLVVKPTKLNLLVAREPWRPALAH